MANDADFRRAQRKVAVGMAAAAFIAIFTISGTLAFGNGAAPPLDERVATALKADLFPALWLLASIANVARLRFFSVQDIDGSGTTDASPSVRIANAVLQNTLEQLVLAVAVHLALAVTLPNPKHLLVGLALLFCMGRACFWLGYAKGAPARAFGFALTFYPTALSLLIGIAVIATGWTPQQ